MAIKTLDEAIEAISVLAQAHVELQAIVKSQGEMIQAQDLAIRALVRLQTSDHVELEYLGHQRKRNADQR
jgi:hypothetical protein